MADDTVKTTTTTTPWAPIVPYVENAYGQLDQAAQNLPQYYQGNQVAGFTPWQTAGQGQITDYASTGMQPMIDASQQATQWGMGAVQDPYSNQALQAHIAAAQRPLTQAYQEQVMPGIADQAEMYGGAGNRTGLAEGVASRGYMDAMGDVSSGMMSQAYGQGLDQQAKMMALMPQTLQAGAMPGQFMSQVGGQQQMQNQAEIAADMNKWNYEQNIPMQHWSNYINTLQSTPWGTSVSEGPDPNAGGGGLTGAIGGGMAGAAMGNMLSAGTWLGAGPAMALGPAGWAGLAGGALLGAYS